MHEDTVHLLARQKKLKDEYNDPDVLPKISKSDMAVTIDATKEYLRSCHGVIRAPLADIIRKAIIVQNYGDYPTYATHDNEMITRIYTYPQKRTSSF